MTDDRLVPLEGALNCRDLGGYRTVDGRTVRWGRVYRSDGLHELTDADLDTLGELGIRLVVDLRNDSEVTEFPSRFPHRPEVERLHLPIGHEATTAGVLELIQSGRVYGIDGMIALYVEFLEGWAAQFGEVIARAADETSLPMLFHCTAGKDRTGITAALLLEALGVPEQDLLADYELTTTYRSGKRLEVLRPMLEENGVDIEAAMPLLTAQQPVLAGTLAAVRREYGTVEGFLTGPAGLTPQILDQLRQLLLS